ncbi:MAG: T9SS type A sorting domain-containing protein [Candidatus Delongbacteria bacterium]|nr:T9SS type A sorting domain-containing protein [Candidatus Delongbacteria bacterium]
MKHAYILTILMTIITRAFSLNDSKELFSYQSAGYSGGEIILSIPDYEITEFSSDGTDYSRIIFDKGVHTNRKGFAELPYLSASIQIGQNRNMTAVVSGSDFIDIKLEYPMLPSRGPLTRDQDISKIPYVISEESLTDKWYPENLIENSEPFIIRDTRGINVVFYPFRYNAEKNILRIYRSVTVKLTENEEEPVNVLPSNKGLITGEMEGVYRSLYINYNESKSLQVGDRGEILVIYTPENGGLDALKPYIDWKMQLGHKVHTLEVPNGTDLDASGTVRQAYESNNNILYVQPVGDWANLKSRYSLELDGSKDPVLGCVAGNDKYQDVIIGRFSANDSLQLSIQINKTIEYERDPDISGEWYTKALALASNEGEGIGDDGESDEIHNEIINNYKLLPSTYTEVYTGYQADGAGSTLISSYINQGVSLINYTGHGYTQGWGGPSFSNTNVNNLTNENRLPFIVSVACVVGHFSGSSDCFAEAWLKKAGGGAVAGWFATINQPWVPPMRGQDYFNDILIGGYDYTHNPGNGDSTSDQMITFGSIAVNAAALTLGEAPSDASTISTVETWTVFGDAALQVRRDKPVIPDNMNNTVFIDNYSTTVLSNGLPAQGATVSLFQNGNVFCGITDAEGNVSIDHTFIEGDIVLTVSGFNLAPIQETLPVIIPQGPYLTIRDYSFSTTDYGELSSMNFMISNIGLENSDGINMSVSTDSEYVQMIQDNYTFEIDSLRPEQTATVEGAFSFMIDPNVPDQERIRFDIAINDSFEKNSYNSTVYMTANAPVIEISHSFDTESAIQGEDQQVSFFVKNEGHAGSGEITAVLDQITEFDIQISSSVNLEPVPPGATAELVFNCSYGTDILNSSKADYKLSLNSTTGLTEEYFYSQAIGMTDNFSTGDFTANNWVFSGDKEWIIDDLVYFEKGFSASSGEVGDSESSSISVIFNYLEDGEISFYRKVSSELTYDKLGFYINGQLKSFWSGNRDWAKESYDVSAGINEFKWTFSRDASYGSGANKAWIDNILATGISTSDIECENEALPVSTELYQNYPNPFNPFTQIKFALSKASEVKLSVYNISGQKVAELENGSVHAGIHTVNFDGSRFNSGVYYYTLETDGKALTKKMILIK